MERRCCIKLSAAAILYAFIIYIVFLGVSASLKRPYTSSASTAPNGFGNNFLRAPMVPPSSTSVTMSPLSHIPEIIRSESPPCKSMPKPAIVVLTFNRPAFLERTLMSLLSISDVRHYDVYISQDGNDPFTAAKSKQFEEAHPTLITHWQKNRPLDTHGIPVYGFVAQHYKWVLDRLFLEQNHSHVVIVEDDMEFSVDFLHLFQETAWLLDEDPTLMCISSWNDNSRSHLGTDPSLLFRNSYFPGLGWMLNSHTYVKDLRDGWPKLSHWDNWLRGNIEKDCVSPSMPRNRNFGSVGSNMNAAAFSKDIANVEFYQGAQPVDFGDVSYLLNSEYEKKMNELVSQSVRIASPTERENLHETGMVYLLLYGDTATFAGLANYFRIWGHPRSHYRFLQVIEYMQNLYLVADVRFCPLLPDRLRVLPSVLVQNVIAPQGTDCLTTCTVHGMTCSAEDMMWLNSCSVLKQYFPCTSCILEVGPDIPSFVSGELATKGFCVRKMHNELVQCVGAHVATSRLCSCIPKTPPES